jgi:hypothetical protein
VVVQQRGPKHRAAAAPPHVLDVGDNLTLDFGGSGGPGIAFMRRRRQPRATVGNVYHRGDGGYGARSLGMAS